MTAKIGTYTTTSALPKGGRPVWRNRLTSLALAAGMVCSQAAPNLGGWEGASIGTTAPMAPRLDPWKAPLGVTAEHVLAMRLIDALHMIGRHWHARLFEAQPDTRDFTVRGWFDECLRRNLYEADLAWGTMARGEGASPIDDVGRAFLRIPPPQDAVLSPSPVEKARVAASLFGIGVDDVIDAFATHVRLAPLEKDRGLRRRAYEQRGRWELDPLFFLAALPAIGTYTRTSAASGMLPIVYAGTVTISSLTNLVGDAGDTQIAHSYLKIGTAITVGSANDVTCRDHRDGDGVTTGTVRSLLVDQRGTYASTILEETGTFQSRACARDGTGLWGPHTNSSGTCVVAANTRAVVNITNAAPISGVTLAADTHYFVDDTAAVALATKDWSGAPRCVVESHDGNLATMTTSSAVTPFNHSSGLIVKRINITQTGSNLGTVWLTGGAASNCAFINCVFTGAWEDVIIFVGATGRTNCGFYNCTKAGTAQEAYGWFMGGVGTGVSAWGGNFGPSSQDNNGYTIRWTDDGAGGDEITHCALSFLRVLSGANQNGTFLRLEIASDLNLTGIYAGAAGVNKRFNWGDIDGTGGYLRHRAWGCRVIAFETTLYGGIAGLFTHACWFHAITGAQAAIGSQNNGGGATTNHRADHMLLSSDIPDYYPYYDELGATSSLFWTSPTIAQEDPQLPVFVNGGVITNLIIRSGLYDADAEFEIDGNTLNAAAIQAHANFGAANTFGNTAITSINDPTPTGNGTSGGNPQLAAFNTPYNAVDLRASWYVAGATTTAYRGCWQLLPTAHSSPTATPGDEEVELAWTEGGASNNLWLRYGTPATSLDTTIAHTTGTPLTATELVNDDEYGFEGHNFNASSGLSAPWALVTATPATEGPEPDITVLVNGSPIVEESSVDYGNVTQGSSPSRVFTIRNDGDGDLTIDETGIHVTGDFTLIDDPTADAAVVLEPEETTTFEVQANSAVLGALSAQVEVESDDADEAVFDFFVEGEVVAGAAAGGVGAIGMGVGSFIGIT